MKLNKQEQLVEEIFDDLILKSMGFSTLDFRETALSTFPVQAYKALIGRETHPISREVYVSDDLVDRIYNGWNFHDEIQSDRGFHLTHKALITILEE